MAELPVIEEAERECLWSKNVWDDAVNTANRMKSHGVGDLIQITETTYNLIKEEFVCEPRSIIQIKGKGEMPVWFVIAKR